jgi:Ca-activated chloride channel family protein
MNRFARLCALLLAGAMAMPVASMHAQATPAGQSAPPAQAAPPAPVGMLGQTSAAASQPQAAATTFKAATELVALNVTVTDSRDRYVTGLAKEDFAVFDDGVPQDVTFFASTNVPLDLAIMIDTSASMADKMAFVHEAATRFVHTLRPGDRAEILGFSEQASVLAPFTSDTAALDTAVEATAPHGSTALYTSLYVAIEDLSRLGKKLGDVRRQAIIVLTDGEDTASLLSFDDLLDSAKHAGVAVYTISVISQFDTKRMDEGGGRRFINESDFALKTLSQDTGGRSFFPMELRDLNGVYAQIAQELSSQYSLGYSPKIYGDGAFHRLMVRVLHHPEARSRTRAGYYSSRPVRASLIGGER